MIENEFKIMLTEEQYNAIHAMYEWDSEKRQVNSYYDDPELTCSERHITVRVREVTGRFFLQMKLPAAASDNGAVSRVELEQEISAIPAEIPSAELKNLSGESLPDVKLLGALCTFRSVKRFPGAEIDLDRSEYFGRTDFELEVEYTDESAAEAILAKISAKVHLDRNAPVTGKIRRFLAEYKKNNA